MIDLGLRFTGPHPEPPHSVPRMHNVVPGPVAYIDALGLEAEQAGVVVRTRATPRRADYRCLWPGRGCGAGRRGDG